MPFPPAARRWLDAALGPGSPTSAPVAPVVLRLRGEIRRTPLSDWMPWDGTQTFDASELGFVWTARLRVSRVLLVHAEDRLDAAGGRGGARLFGLLPVGGASGPDATRSQLVRNLAELAFAPAIAARLEGLVWTAEGDDTFWLGAPGVDPGVLVRFDVDAAGDVTLASAADRPRENGRGGFFHEPYRLDFEAHERLDTGIRIPHRSIGTFRTSAGDWTYWRCEVVAVTTG